MADVSAEWGDVYAHELSVRAVSMVLVYFERRYGRQRLEKLFKEQRVPASLDYLRTHTNWVGQRFIERLVELLVEESGEADFVKNASLLTATPEAMGFLYYIIRAVGRPRFVFQKMVELAPTFNVIGKWNIEEILDRKMVLTYRTAAKENNRNFCIGRAGQFASFTTIWGLPPARPREINCMLDGADCCRYIFEWDDYHWPWRRYLGSVLGLGVGGGLAALGQGHAALELSGWLLFGGALGAYLDERVSTGRLTKAVEEQNHGLSQSMHDLERQNAEVWKTNLELEKRVDERTEKLSEANAQLERAKAEVEGALSKQQELDRLKTRFFDNVSHELRTPLTLILLSLESLKRSIGLDTSSKALQSHIDPLERSAVRLHQLINQLLDLAKIEAGKVRLRYTAVDLTDFLKGAIIPFSAAAADRKISLTLEGNLSEAVHVDEEKVDQVFQNLLANAVKFTPEGGKVTVRLSETPTHGVVEVIDTGVGIAEEDLPNLFDRFSQADNVGLKRFGGTGIGLSLVKETIELHGGTIRVNSRKGEGSCFRIEFPKGKEHIRPELIERRGRDAEVSVINERRASGRDPLDRVFQSSISALATSTPSAKPESAASVSTVEVSVPDEKPLTRTVLVVEDDPDLRSFLCGLLGQNYQVLEAADGEIGLELIAKKVPDLVVSDVAMPKMSGLQLTKRLRDEAKTAELPIILLTSRREEASVVDGLGTGANDYLGKPFSPRELLARADVQLRLRDASARAAANERLATLGMLSSGFAHEVRNPLNGLINATQPIRDLMGETKNRSAVLDLLNVIEECGKRVHHVSETLLSLGRRSGVEGRVNLSQTLETTLEVLSWRMTDGIEVVRDFSFKGELRGDSGALSQVWLNLIDNALRAIGPRGKLTLSTRELANEVEVTVEDSGPGMDAHTRARLFQPFFSTRPAGEGTGLGLALCKRVVLEHQGRIRVESEPGRGARFTVTLPKTRQPMIPVAAVAANVASAMPSAVPSELPQPPARA